MNLSLLTLSYVVALFVVCVEARWYGRRCPPVCAIFCPFGNVKDKNGCDTCNCKGPPPDLCPPGYQIMRPTRFCDIFSPADCGPNGFCPKGGRFGQAFCCTRNVLKPVYRCPPNDIITTCEIRPNSCIRQSDCPPGSICCPRGCGKECINVFGVPHYSG